jgi:hypothetical protein
MLAGVLPKDTIAARVAAGALAIVEVISTTGARVKHRTVSRVLKRPASSSVLSEKVLAEDRSSRSNNSSQYRDRIHSAVGSLAAARG